MGIRTPDLLIANETLYHLSYTPIYSVTTVICRYREFCLSPLNVTPRFSLWTPPEALDSAFKKSLVWLVCTNIMLQEYTTFS